MPSALEQQHTLGKTAGFSGTSLHTGEKVTLKLHPAPADHGIKFKRADLQDEPTIDAKIDNLKMVPEGDPNYLAVLKSIASVYSNINRMDEARETQRQVLKIEPSDAEAHYTVGVLDYTEAYKNARTALAANGLEDDGMGNAKLAVSPCLELREKNSALISDGIDQLTRAIELNSKYDDAMAYMNLVYRRRADLACGDESVRAADTADSAAAPVSGSPRRNATRNSLTSSSPTLARS